MDIRRAHESEAPILSALALEAKEHWGYSPHDIAHWRPNLVISAREVDAQPTFVAAIEKVRVGFYSLVPAPQTWELNHLWVSPQFQRRGLGRALLTHAKDTARAGGAASIAIDADPNAEPFYVKCGAIRQGVVAAPIADDPGRCRPQLILRVRNNAA